MSTPPSVQTDARPSTPPVAPVSGVDAAFVALVTYDQGSSRGDLLPIDRAVIAGLNDRKARAELERRLVAAREYLCSKLTLIGSEFALPALATLLGHPDLATAARNALESSPHGQASKVLRQRLPELAGVQQVGVIQSLGIRRDARSITALTRLLTHPSLEVVSATTAALGEIGTPSAAKALRDFLPRVPQALQLVAADACLVCAERLLKAGQPTDARRLYGLLTASNQPKQVQSAATQGLTAVATAKRS